MRVSVLLVVYWTVFLTEILGDKSIYTISSLALRFGALAVFCGLTGAYAIKMLVAIFVGQALTKLPAALVASISAFTFFTTALVLWFKPTKDETRERALQPLSRSVAFSFTSLLLIEWGDVGQITAATLAVHYQSPLTVWLGASLALMTKGILAIMLGLSLRRYVPRNVLRVAAVASCVVMGLLSVLQFIRN